MQDFITGLNPQQLENLKKDLQTLNQNNINVPQNGESRLRTKEVNLSTAIGNVLEDRQQALSQYLQDLKGVRQDDKLFKDGAELGKALELGGLQSRRSNIGGTSLTNLPQVIQSINGAIKNREKQKEAATKIQAVFRGQLSRKEAAQRQEAQRQEAQRQEAQRQEAQRQEAEYLDQFDGILLEAAAQRQEAQRQEAQRQEAQKQEAAIEAMLDKIKIAFKDHSKDPKEFFEKVLGATEYDTIKGNKADLKTLEKGFKALKANYPDGEITNNFAKVKDNEKFKDFLKICLIVVTLGVAALFDATTLQSTHKKNYESFTKLVEEKNKNPSQGNSIS